MTNFKYLGSLLKSQNYIHENKNCRLKAGNSGYYSVQILLLFSTSLREFEN